MGIFHHTLVTKPSGETLTVFLDASDGMLWPIPPESQKDYRPEFLFVRLTDVINLLKKHNIPCNEKS